jgi:hypothetical protein
MLFFDAGKKFIHQLLGFEITLQHLSLIVLHNKVSK